MMQEQEALMENANHILPKVALENDGGSATLSEKWANRFCNPGPRFLMRSQQSDISAQYYSVVA